MKHELIECITSEELFVDLNDDPQFRKAKLSELLTESKVVVYFPDYMLLVSRWDGNVCVQPIISPQFFQYHKSN